MKPHKVGPTAIITRRRFPSGWQMCLLLADLKPGELALDPFAGIGSTLLAAQRLSVRAIGIEIDPSYCAAARRRLKEAAETAGQV